MKKAEKTRDCGRNVAPNPGDIATQLTHHLVMTGMMGVGKSRIGRALADRLGLPFVDCDTEIEKAAGCSIADYFAQYGEATFRDGEHKVIDRLLHAGEISVIASGGGAVTHKDTLKLFKENACTIWLMASVDTLVARTSGNDRRPLLKTGDPKEILTNILEQRQSMYKDAASLMIDADTNNVDDTVNNIMQALHTHLTNK